MRQLLVFFALPVLLLVAGCNDDVFLDESYMPDNVVKYTIEGDGGETTFTIPTKGLERVSLDVFSESERNCTYYNAAGDIVDRYSPASEVSRIVFETIFTRFELHRQGKTLTVKNQYNSFDYGSWTIRLEYSYGVRFIYVTVLPGKPMRLLEVVYHPDGMKIDDRAKVKTKRFGFNNASPLPQILEVRPYLDETYSILVEPEDKNSWVIGKRLNMEVPVYEDGSWQMKETSLIPGFSSTYSKKEYLMKVDVDVPAYSNVNIFTDIIYGQAKSSGYMTFLNEVLNRKLTVNFTVTSLYPTAYEIRTEDAK
ncbi:MAG: hypothetical protein Q4F85_01390 [Prevotella sp.]|nr:hypothetical protein [Prevotella sp.]